MELGGEFQARTINVAVTKTWKVFKTVGVNDIIQESVWREKGRDPW